MVKTKAHLQDAAADRAAGLVIKDITAEIAGHGAFRDHEKVLHGRDETAGLEAIIAIHSTRRGPAIGGTRIWPHPSFDVALTDVLRLSHGMTLKAAVAGLAHGGGKALIIADAKSDKNEALLTAYAAMLRTVADQYYTAEDVGMTLQDADFLRAQTPNVLGTTIGGSGNPSPLTALGTFMGLKAAVKHRLGAERLDGLHVAVQGLGSVGYALAAHLHGDGAVLTVADLDQGRLDKAREELGANIADPNDIIFAKADVLSPCALGGILSERTIPGLNVPIIAGAANNQLATLNDADRLKIRDILYTPDYVLNAGGLMNVAAEIWPDGYDLATVEAEIGRIPVTLTEIFQRAQRAGSTTEAIARAIAEERLSAA